ncbi:MAG: hypothetical protein KA354_22305 [Phycisphaerae bacterium]|nr:hypothetical protein [Phycisphaerae bacterium]
MSPGRDARGGKQRYVDDKNVLLAELTERGSNRKEILKVINVSAQGAALCGKNKDDHPEVRAELGLINKGQIRMWMTNGKSRGPIDMGEYRVVRQWKTGPIPGIGISADPVNNKWVRYCRSQEFAEGLRRPPGNNQPRP